MPMGDQSLHKISIIIPVYNAERTLRESVHSVLNQDYDNLEVILVNDGSTDASLEICHKLSEYDKRVKVVDKPNGGPNTARNRGLEVAAGEFIAFVDADDEFFSSDTLSANMTIILDDQEVDVVSFPQYREYKEKNSLIIKHKDAQLKRQTLTDKREMFINWIYGKLIDGCYWGKIYRKSIFNGWKLIEEISFTEDIYDIPNLCERCRKIVVSGKGGYLYKFNEESIIHSDYSSDKLKGHFLSELNLYTYLQKFEDVEELKDITYHLILTDGYYLLDSDYEEYIERFSASLPRRSTVWKGRIFIKFLCMMTLIFGFHNGLKISKRIITKVKKLK